MIFGWVYVLNGCFGLFLVVCFVGLGFGLFWGVFVWLLWGLGLGGVDMM